MRAALALLAAAVLAQLLWAELARRRLPLEARYPVIDPATGERASGYFGDLNLGVHTLLNVVLAPFLPARVEIEPVVEILTEAVKRSPLAATALGFKGGECEDTWPTALRTLAAGLNEAGWVSPLGRMAFPDEMSRFMKLNADLMDFLETRLKADGSLPDIDLPLIFIAGNYRTGTTALQRVLAQDERLLTIPQWALQNPLTIATLEEAIKFDKLVNSSDMNNPMRYLSTEVFDASFSDHPMEPLLAEEDGGYLTNRSPFQLGIFTGSWLQHSNSTFMTQVFASELNRRCFFTKLLPGYLSAWTHRDSPLRRFWKSSAGEPRALVLKGPQYGQGVDLIKQTFPKAKVVATHRPVETQIKAAVLHYQIYTPIFGTPSSIKIPATITLDHVEAISASLARDKRAIDLNLKHSDIVGDIIGAAERVLRLVGLDLPSEQRKRMEAFIGPGGKGNWVGRKWTADERCVGLNWAEEAKSRPGLIKYAEAFANFF